MSAGSDHSGEPQSWDEYQGKPPVSEVRRAALCLLGEDVLVRLLRLPAGWTITGVAADFERNGILLRITGPTAPEVPEGAIPWQFQPETEYEAPSREEREANPHAAGTMRIVLPDWLIEGDTEPWKRTP